MRPKIIVAEAHPIVRHGLRVALLAEKEFRVVDEAGDGLSALQLVERHRPDALMLGLILTGIDGLELIRQAKNKSPSTRSLVFSNCRNEGAVWEAIRGG